MSEAQLIKPDLGYVKEVIAAGGESLKKCYQCATCTVVCDITGDAQPFPRKEMVWAQWGLKERLINDADVWLCHQCADCTAKCPRDAKPGEVLGAIRRTAYRAHAVPAFMGTLFSDIKYLPVVFAIPVVILAAMIMLNNQPQVGSHIFPLWGGQGFMPTGEIVFSKMMPITTGVDADVPDGRLPRRALGVREPQGLLGQTRGPGAGLRAAQGLRAEHDGVPRRARQPRQLQEVHGERRPDARRTCSSSTGSSARSSRRTSCWSTSGGPSSASSTNWRRRWPSRARACCPKVFGNVGGLAIVFGALLMIGNRMSKSEESPASGYDWVFLGSIFLVGATGMLTEIFRLMNSAALAYPMYFVHLVFVFYVIAFLPYSKLAHLLYRPLAIIHAKNVGRDTAAPAAKAA